MSITSITKDAAALTMTIVAEFDHPVERVWRLWEDPRKLERWWGPPGYPATFTDFDLSPGGRVAYYMTGPEGERHGGWWRVTDVAAPSSLAIDDGFADDQGNPSADMPVMKMRVDLAARDGGGTVMTMVTAFPDEAAMQLVIEMGMEEGISMAMGQMEPILAEMA